MLLPIVRRRWPMLTTLVAGMLYIANNYDIRGLETVRLEPRPLAEFAVSNGSGSGGIGWPASFPSGPTLPSVQLPSSLPSSLSLSWPSTSTSLSPTSMPSPAHQPSPTPITPLPQAGLPQAVLPQAGWPPGAAGYPATAVPTTNGYSASGAGASANGYGFPTGYAPGAELGDRGLSIGEKLAMLDQAQSQAASNHGFSATALSVSGGGAGATGRQRDAIRIASFNLSGWGEAKRGNIAAAGLLTRLLGQFDLIAVQDIRSRQDDTLPELVSHLNSGGRKFDFMIGPRVGRGERREQLGFLFDTERLETDRFQLYTVDDPEDMLSREPLVGWFRTVNAISQDAFTFSLVNIHIDPDLAHSELRALPVLVQAIINDGRGEDDVILAGDFSAPAAQLEMLAASGMRVLLDGVATTTRGSLLVDNFAFPQSSTTEYTGRSGAFDFLRQFNLSLEQAVEVSEHLPIWAEFSIIEGGRPGQVAASASPEHRFRNGAN